MGRGSLTEITDLSNFDTEAIDKLGQNFLYILNGVFGPFALAGILGNIYILYIVGYKRLSGFGCNTVLCSMAVLDMINTALIIWQLSTADQQGSRTTIECKLLVPLLPFLIQTSSWFKAYVSYSIMK